MLNWIFVDSNTLELRYGSRIDSTGHIIGPWGWTEDKEMLTLDDDEGFVAVEDEGQWKLYFDRYGDLSGLPKGKIILELSLKMKKSLGIESTYIRR